MGSQSVLRSPAHLVCPTCGQDPKHRSLSGRSPAPGGGESRSGQGPPSRRAWPIRRCGLRRRVTRRAESAAGLRYRFPARTPGSGLGGEGPARSEAGRAAGRRRPAPLARPAMQGPAGNSSHSLPVGSPSTVASGAGRCESGALMHSFGIFLQGLLGVVAFSTLMRESGTPALLKPCAASLGPTGLGDPPA